MLSYAGVQMRRMHAVTRLCFMMKRLSITKLLRDISLPNIEESGKRGNPSKFFKIHRSLPCVSTKERLEDIEMTSIEEKCMMRPCSPIWPLQTIRFCLLDFVHHLFQKFCSESSFAANCFVHRLLLSHALITQRIALLAVHSCLDLLEL